MRDRSADIEKLADLLVGFGANVQPGQVLGITANLDHREAVQAAARAAYRRGASFVDVFWWDPWVKRVRIEEAADDTLDWVPPWIGARLRALGDRRAARLTYTGPFPSASDGLDPARTGKDMLPWVGDVNEVVNARTTNWTAGPHPNADWARLIHPDLEPEAALDRLWEQIIHILRLDEPDPIAAWESRMTTTKAVAERLTARRFDALHFTGPGTDLTVGLLPSSRWLAAEFTTIDGIVHYPNLPSEEIFTTPDPARVDGHVASTKSLEWYGSTIEGIRVRFEQGRAVQIDADSGVEALRAAAGRDEGASRVGEVALVDRDGRIGPFGTVFYDTLLDENAASHIALGNAYRFALADEADHPRANTSGIHIDFMIGSSEVDVDGVTKDGERVPVLRGGDWEI